MLHLRTTKGETLAVTASGVEKSGMLKCTQELVQMKGALKFHLSRSKTAQVVEAIAEVIDQTTLNDEAFLDLLHNESRLRQSVLQCYPDLDRTTLEDVLKSCGRLSREDMMIKVVELFFVEDDLLKMVVNDLNDTAEEGWLQKLEPPTLLRMAKVSSELECNDLGTRIGREVGHRLVNPVQSNALLYAMKPPSESIAMDANAKYQDWIKSM